jgi:SH3 domain protein
LLLALGAAPAGAETAWVKDELTLNLRSGPGTQYRILGAVQTGDSVEVLQRTEGWTKVRVAGDSEDTSGWIPAGYLQAEQPAEMRLASFRSESAEMRERFETLNREVATLRSENETLAEQDGAQREEIAQLTRENLELRAGARWPEWIAGAGLLCAGMVLGAFLHKNASRRQGPRIRL